jgi:hypothetical protein
MLDIVRCPICLGRSIFPIFHGVRAGHYITLLWAALEYVNNCCWVTSLSVSLVRIAHLDSDYCTVIHVDGQANLPIYSVIGYTYVPNFLRGKADKQSAHATKEG